MDHARPPVPRGRRDGRSRRNGTTEAAPCGLFDLRRCSTGRPGRNYAQLRTDYTINARLDPGTQRITGRETLGITPDANGPLDQLEVMTPSSVAAVVLADMLDHPQVQAIVLNCRLIESRPTSTTAIHNK